ncbi:delta-aminolevulinic acid dehydratase [candidate division KSB1 bacterium]|nr:delta-aminolevulinic acid dehydratase [candidate division KSB1 bacterium]
MLKERTALIFENLLDLIQRQKWCGFDPFDALNSPFLNRLFAKNRLAGIAIVQLFKRSPVNLRTLFRVQPAMNSKGVGLYLSSLCRLYDTRYWDKKAALEAADWLCTHRSPASSFSAWGYPFDWPNRAFFAPAHTPTVVGTTFVAHSLLDIYALTKHPQYVETAISAGQFILHELNRSHSQGPYCFSYTPVDRRFVHNANLLAAGLLSRLYGITNAKELKEAATLSTLFSLNAQNPDGRWPYGISKQDSWIDHFHTAFNLLSLKQVSKYLDLSQVRQSMVLGTDYYIQHFFDDFMPKYYHNRLYPVDIHSIATAIIALLDLDFRKDQKHRAAKLVEWTIHHMRSPKGTFYYQYHRFYKNKIIYMRWGQMWMLYALATFLANEME